MQREAQERAWAETYQDFETEALVKAVVAVGGHLEILLQEPEAVSEVMLALAQKFGQEPHGNWRETWAQFVFNFGAFRSSAFCVALNAFAFGGLRPDAASVSDLGDGPLDEQLAAMVQRARALLDAIPAECGGSEDLRKTVEAAEARFSLDCGKPVSIDGLAALARINTKSIRNLLTPKSGATVLSIDADGRIPAQAALEWLSGRESFLPSIWREHAVESSAMPEGDEDLGDVYFIPVAADGTAFEEDFCRSPGGYRIGPKGNEEVYGDYDQALNRLCRMTTPRWRRPNRRNHWGIVAGVAWRRVAGGPKPRR